ncbi:MULTISPECIES: ABC transporter permease [Xanthobacter]|uniref:ABC transporter permease n=1 Tax=Xanthobacter flavus TaxID=281 RepID=A0A9W6CT37_XANFL|nr:MULTISPECIES: ABC transporter permease [Xanthobacter]MBN8916928.1 ABC transporter permease [Hyphomicrobiales bacterium]MDR6336110.1 NitT/TauT family transport system permease protein [Xanthobacter flavus]UDQ89481.1 ABC transporter permease [Xanthobacter autotrophicus]UJX43715.1 ABC transporter permease [Xanthobacter sp. YC-JY1]GLI24864.1 ABC transporter permease [Xanthobacter flavus]
MASPRHRNPVLAVIDAPWARPVGLLVILIAIWDISVRIFQIPAYLIPTPWDVMIAFRNDGAMLAREAVPTTIATLAGFALSAAIGIPLAMLIAGSRTIEAYLYPLLVFSQSIPKVAIAPLFVVWFGFGIVPKVISAFLLGVFPVVVAGVQGFKSVEADMRDLARSMKASRLQTFAMVSLPHAMPAIFAGLKVSVTLAVVGAVVGEFVGSNSGLGFVLQRSIGNFELPTMFAALIVLALIGVVLFWVVDLVERLIVPWHASQRHDVFVTV